MTRSIRLGVLAAAAALALALAAVASAAYTTPTLKVSQVGAATTISVTQAQTDDATARAVIFAPVGIQATLTQAAGTKLGPVKAIVTALALGGALLPVEGDIVVAAPGQVAAASQTACIGTSTPAATWLMALSAANTPLAVPMYVLPTFGTETALGSAKIVVCLPPPDVPVNLGGATFGAKLFNASFVLNGVFGASPLSPWTSIWTPYTAGNGLVNAAGSVASPSVIAPGAVTAAAKKTGTGTVVAGKVTQAATGVAGLKVEIWAGKTRAGLKRVARVTSKAGGAYTFATRNAGPFFRARVVAAGRAAPELCQALGASLPVPCVNSTVSGFTALSAIARR